MAVFCSFRLDAYFLTIIAGIENTERVTCDFSNGTIATNQVDEIALRGGSGDFAAGSPKTNSADASPTSSATVEAASSSKGLDKLDSL